MLNEDSLNNRYSRQELLEFIGEAGQLKLGQSSAVILGCGGLGCNIAGLLVRAGIGKVRIIDKDSVNYTNLHRQTLYDENDAKDHVPKAIAARKHLQAINSLIDIEGIVDDLNPANIEKYCAGMDVILDGLDNFEARYLANDVSLKLGIPYVYGGATGSMGMTMTVIPGVTPCLRCVFPDPPPPGAVPSGETAGVLATAPQIIGSFQVTEAIKLCLGSELVNSKLTVLDVWNNSFESLPVVKRPGCPACNGKYEFMEMP